MKKLVAAALSGMAIVTLCVSMIALDARPSFAGQCTWGQLKICYNKHLSTCVCKDPRPKDNGVLGVNDAWVPAFLNATLRQALRIVLR